MSQPVGERGYSCVLSLGGQTIGKTMNLSYEMVKTEFETTRREGAGWQDGIGTVKRLTATIEALWVLSDASLSQLKTAWLNDSNLAFEIVDGSGHGWSGYCGVMRLAPGQNTADAVVCSIDIVSRGTVTNVVPSS
jgi:predicted secreted protein